MHIDVSRKNGVSVFAITGDIDIESSPDVKRSFDKAITAENNNIVINLKAVGYVDSSGLATLVEVLKNVQSKGGKLKLANLSAKVKGLFEITRLDKLFDISDNEEDAVSSF